MQLTRDNYFSPAAQATYMSVSQYKAFEECEAAALAEIRGEKIRQVTAALLVGSYVDAWFEGTLDEYRAAHPELFRRDGTLKAEIAAAQRVIDRVQKDPLFMGYMAGQKQVIMTGYIEGIPFKVKVDSLHPDKIVDLKVMRSFDPVYRPGQGRLIWPQAWGYDVQGAVYQEIVRQNTGQRMPFYLAAATKEEDVDLDVLQISQPYLDEALARVKENLPRFDAVKSGVLEPMECGHCGWCRQHKVLSAPRDMEELFDE